MAGADAIILPMNDFMGISAMEKMPGGGDSVSCAVGRPQGGKRSAAFEMSNAFLQDSVFKVVHCAGEDFIRIKDVGVDDQVCMFAGVGETA